MLYNYYVLKKNPCSFVFKNFLIGNLLWANFDILNKMFSFQAENMGLNPSNRYS